MADFGHIQDSKPYTRKGFASFLDVSVLTFGRYRRKGLGIHFRLKNAFHNEFMFYSIFYVIKYRVAI